MAIVEEAVCRCGRVYTHCRNVGCGGHNLYPLKYRSMAKSLTIGRQITVYRCKKCGNETDETMECQAQPESLVTDFKAYQKKQDVPAWGNLIPGTEQYLNALNERAVELTQKKNITLLKAYVECVKQGWSLEGLEPDEDLKEALSNAGCPTEGNAQDQSVVGHGGDLGAKEASLPIQEPVSLDDIIRTMQEEQK